MAPLPLPARSGRADKLVQYLRERMGTGEVVTIPSAAPKQQEPEHEPQTAPEPEPAPSSPAPERTTVVMAQPTGYVPKKRGRPTKEEQAAARAAELREQEPKSETEARRQAEQMVDAAVFDF